MKTAKVVVHMVFANCHACDTSLVDPDTGSVAILVLELTENYHFVCPECGVVQPLPDLEIEYLTERIQNLDDRLHRATFREDMGK